MPVADQCGLALGALGFHQSKRFAIIAPQDIVDEAFTGLVRHAGDRKFAITGMIERPARLMQEDVNEGVAGLRLVVIVGVCRSGIRLFDGGDFGAKTSVFRLDLDPLSLGLHTSGFGRFMGLRLVGEALGDLLQASEGCCLNLAVRGNASAEN